MADINTGNMSHSIVRSFDEGTDSLKTTITNADVNINVSAFTDSIKIGDANGDTVTITNVSGKKSLDVNVTDITLDKSNDSVTAHNPEELVFLDEAYAIELKKARTKLRHNQIMNYLLLVLLTISITLNIFKLKGVIH